MDDSSVARNLLKGILDADPYLEVVGEAKDGVEAVELVSHLKPDVVIHPGQKLMIPGATDDAPTEVAATANSHTIQL